MHGHVCLFIMTIVIALLSSCDLQRRTDAADKKNGEVADEKAGENRPASVVKSDLPVLVVQNGHNQPLTSSAWSPDSKILATGSIDTTIRLWNRDGYLLKEINAHAKTVRHLSWSPDGSILASAGWRNIYDKNNAIRLWNRDGSLLKELEETENPAFIIMWNPYGTIFASCHGDNTIRLWRKDGTFVKLLKGHSANVTNIAWSADGRILASATGEINSKGIVDKTICLWGNDGSLIKSLEGHADAVAQLSWNPDGKLLATGGSADKTIHIWNKDGSLLKKIPNCKDFSWGPAGKYFATLNMDNVIMIWGNNGSLLKKLNNYTSVVTRIYWATDSGDLVSVHGDNTLRIWGSDGSLLREYKIKGDTVFPLLRSPDAKYISLFQGNKIIVVRELDGSLMELPEYQNYIYGWSPDGDVLVTLGEDNKTICFWKSNGCLIKTIKGHTEGIASLNWTPDGTSLSTGSFDKTIRLWDLNNRNVKTIRGHLGCVTQLGWDKDGVTLASLASKLVETNFSCRPNSENALRIWSRDGTLVKTLSDNKEIFKSFAWNPDGVILAHTSGERIVLSNRKGDVLKKLDGHEQTVQVISWNPGGTMLASGSFDGTVILWRRDGTLIKKLKVDSSVISLLAWSPDGKILASGTSKSIRFWTSEGNPIKELIANGAGVSCILWNHDGSMLASADKEVCIWNREGTLIDKLESNMASIHTLAWNPGGRILACGSPDGTICVWDIDRKSIKHFMGHNDYISGILWSPDGNKLITGSFDSSVKIWSSETGECLLTLLSFDDGSSLASTPDGHFDYSGKQALDYVAYKMGDRFIDLKEIFSAFWVKDLYKKVMTGNYRSGNVTFLRDILKNPPDIRVLFPTGSKAQQEYVEETVEVGFRISDGGAGISDAKVLVNGAEKWSSGVDTDFSKTICATIPLVAGRNAISVVAYNKNGGPITEDVPSIYRKAYDLKKVSTLHVLAVGVDKYEKKPLNFCVSDADAFMKAVTKGASTFFLDVKAARLMNEQASQARIMNELERIAKEAKPHDVVVLYFSGHGASARFGDKKVFAYIPQDYPWKGDEAMLLQSAGVTGDFIAQQIRKMPQKVVLIMDCCQSGDILLALQGTRTGGVDNDEMLQLLANGTGIFVLTAAAGTELAREIDPKHGIPHGIFTYALLQGIEKKSADEKGDGVITVKELARYIDRDFGDYIKKYISPSFRQTPVVNSMGRDSYTAEILDFPLVSLKGAAPVKKK